MFPLAVLPIMMAGCGTHHLSRKVISQLFSQIYAYIL